MASPETFDPKRYQPFEKGLPVERVMSTFPAIDTAVDNIKFTAGLENLAQVMDRGTLIRSHVQPDLGHILHSRHQYHWHTGYVPPQTVAAPHMGAWMARVLGPQNPVMPAFVDVGQRLEIGGEKEELKAFHTAGFFGGEFGPFMLPDPADAVSAVRPPAGMTPERFESRYKHYRELVLRGPLGRTRQRPSTGVDDPRAAKTPTACSTPRSASPSTSARSSATTSTSYNTGRFGLGLPARPPPRRSRLPLRRSHDRVRPLRRLGHARRRPLPRRRR